MSSFTCIVIQSNVTMPDVSQDIASIRTIERKNLSRVLELIDWAAANRYPGDTSVKLIGLPESFLHSFPRAKGAQVAEAFKYAIEIPGEETQVLAERCRRHNAYIFGAAYEVDREWPGRVFNTGFILSPDGELILKYRKVNCGEIESSTSPHDILDAYVHRYGHEALFPVVDTPIGRLGMLICADGLFGPELARSLTMRGAEILCMPMSSTSPDHGYYHLAAQARALDNVCYVVSPNLGRTFSKERAEEAGGESLVVNYDGRVLAKAAAFGETTMTVHLDVEPLREHRHRSSNLGVRGLRAECYAPLYQQTYLPANGFLHRLEESLEDEREYRRQAREGLYQRSILVPPAGGR